MLVVEELMQSEKEWILTGPMRIQFVHVPLPAGEAMSKTDNNDTGLMQVFKEKRSVIVMKEESVLCVGDCCRCS